MRRVLIAVLLLVSGASLDARAAVGVGVPTSSSADIVAIDRLCSRATTTTPVELASLLPQIGRTADGPSLVWPDGTLTPLEGAPGYWASDRRTRTLTIGLSRDPPSPLAPTIYRLFDLDRPDPGIELFRATPIAEGGNILQQVHTPSGKAILADRLAPVPFGFIAMRGSRVWLHRTGQSIVEAELPPS